MKIKTANWFEDETILDYDPEFADMGNPDGAVYGKRYFVEVTTEDGARFVHQTNFTSFEDAAKLADRVRLAGEINPEKWSEAFPVFGSLKWEAEEAERWFNLQAARMSGDSLLMEQFA